MSTIRWKSLPPFRRDRFGYYLCRLCKKPCPENDRFWCSEECLRRSLTASHGSFVRAQLFERDNGICAECGVNAAQMDNALARLGSDLLHPLLMTIHPMIVKTLRTEGWTNVKLRGRGSYPDAVKFSSCWEAHHIQSVIAGGGECGIENYRTLCFMCHKKVSAEQARMRAHIRRLKKRKIQGNTIHASPVKAAPLTRDRPNSHQPLHAFHWLRLQFTQGRLDLQCDARRFAEQQRLADILGQRLDARRDVHGVADCGEFQPLRRADAADDGRAGVEANADGERRFAPRGEGGVQLRHVREHLPPRGEALVRVRPAAGPRAEERHEAVAEVFVDHAAVLLLDDADHGAEELIEYRDDAPRVRAAGARGEAADVHKHDGDDLFAAAEARIVRENLLGGFDTDMEAEGLAQALLFRQFADHAVEFADERTEFVRALEGDAYGESPRATAAAATRS